MISCFFINFMRHIAALIIVFMFFSGCESDKNNTVTSALFYRNAGPLESISVESDSMSFGTKYKHRIGKSSCLFAGKYKNFTAFSVIKFQKPRKTILDSLYSASMKLVVKEVWLDGDFDFGIHFASSEWSGADSTRLDPEDFSTDLGVPISVVSDSSGAVSFLLYDNETSETNLFDDWDVDGSFQIRNTDIGETLVAFSSDDSNSPPYIELVYKNELGETDTTTIKSIEGTYHLSAGNDEDDYTVSDGDASGFVMNINISNFPPPPTSMHGSELTLVLSEKMIVTEQMLVMLYRLTSEFTIIEDVQKDSGSVIEFFIKPDVSTYKIDISKYLNSWYNNKDPNYGIILESTSRGVSLNYAVFEKPDSLVINYSTLPEVE